MKQSPLLRIYIFVFLSDRAVRPRRAYMEKGKSLYNTAQTLKPLKLWHSLYRIFLRQNCFLFKKKGFSGGPRPPFGIFWMSGWTQGSRPAISSNRRQVSRDSPGFFRVGSGRFARFDAHPEVSTRRYF